MHFIGISMVCVLVYVDVLVVIFELLLSICFWSTPTLLCDSCELKTKCSVLTLALKGPFVTLHVALAKMHYLPSKHINDL